MKKNQVIGLLLLVLAIATAVGMVFGKDLYWSVYNFLTILFSVISGIVLLKQK